MWVLQVRTQVEDRINKLGNWCSSVPLFVDMPGEALNMRKPWSILACAAIILTVGSGCATKTFPDLYNVDVSKLRKEFGNLYEFIINNGMTDGHLSNIGFAKNNTGKWDLVLLDVAGA